MWKNLSQQSLRLNESIKSKALTDEADGLGKSGISNDKTIRNDLSHIRRKSLVKKSKTAVGFKMNPIKVLKKVGKYLNKEVKS